MGLQSFDDADSDEARQCLLDRRCERTHLKRHRTLNRARRLSAKKKQAVKHKVALRDANMRRHKTKVAAYWAGETDGHP